MIVSALERVDRCPWPIRWPAKAVLNVGGIVAGSAAFVLVLAGTLLALTIAGLVVGALWRFVFG